MPYYYKVDGLYIWINTRETCHIGCPHVHVSYQGKESSIDLDGHVLDGDIKRKARVIAIRWILENKEYLLSEWRKMHHV